jgi:hypothetical protein
MFLKFDLVLRSMCLQMKNDRFDPDGGSENLNKLPAEMREPLIKAVNKCRKADEGTVLLNNFRN